MQHIRVNDAAQGEGDESPRPRKQRRKQRPCYSCAECRRLKMKCNRKIPCSNCVRRHRVEFCIAAATNRSKESTCQSSGEHSGDVQDPEPIQVGNGQRTSPRQNRRQMDQGQQRGERNQEHLEHLRQQRAQREETCPPEISKEVDPSQQLVGGPQHPPTQGNHSNYDEVNPLNILANALEPAAIPGASPYAHNLATANMMAESPYGVTSRGSVSSSFAQRSIDEDEQSGSFGTLMLTKRGRSKYLGPTAGSEWLKESETQDVSDSPVMTRAPSPNLHPDSAPSQPGHPASHATLIGFPLDASAARISTRSLLASLPPREEAWILAESYYRYCAWHHDVAPKAQFEKTFDRVYKRAELGSSSPAVDPQEIALVFIIMAQGTMFNIEMPNCDESAEEWLHLSERALVKGDFLSNNMVAGLQTLHLMAHLHLHLDKGRRGDNAWPLWGLVMRLIQAMGMHRDGDRWNLPHDVAEERRKVFWECNAADIFQAHCFSRPSAINPEHYDTAFPSEPPQLNGEKSYSILRFELSQISSEILNMAMKVQKPSYSDVTNLDLKLSEFEQNIPFSLRCRAALLAMPSRYPLLETATEASPEPSRRSLTISFRQTNLALNVSETIINLHRPYYAKALYEFNHVESIYRASFFTVIERCAIIISIVADIHARFPAVSTRQWNFWYHVFGSALCLGTLVLRDPGNVMASFVLTQIDAAITLFTSLLQHGDRTPRYKRNLQWLLNLRSRALLKIQKASSLQTGGLQQDTHPARQYDTGDGEVHEDEDVELLGWRTRLVERAGQGRQKTIRTIHIASTPTGSQLIDSPNPPLNESQLEDQLRNSLFPMPITSLSMETPESTNDILHEFWDPMLLQDVFADSHDQSNPSMVNRVNRATWWDDTAITSNLTQPRG